MGVDVRTKDRKHGPYALIYTLSVGHIPRKLAGEPLPNTSVVEESKKDVCLAGNKNEFEEGDPKKENENFVESHESYKEGQQEIEIDDTEKSDGVNLLTHKPNFVLVDNSLCMQESWNKPKENE
ncbi:hypothetical protein M9H77_07886 [Catharanthus roseus]|uniref:Uncharacterized protein n=1 Tax=Catharanthus roseus TaxID=4058 RepID=A0ACC0BW84_CATRO|nr:hypothetical protein M9H77_07886 [Catharanthus roseus]